MLRRIFIIAVLVLFAGGAIIVWRQYRAYQVRRQAQIEQLKQRAEEVSVTTIEGWTVKDIAKSLEDAKLFSAKEFLAALDKIDFSAYPLVEAHKPAKASLEGFLFPDTYRFNKVSAPQMVVDKMLTDFAMRVEPWGITADKDKYSIAGFEQRQLTFYEVLIMASLIEKEGGGKGPMSLKDERALIASVFYNRLAIGQALESDATVNYVTGKTNVATTEADRDFNSPYNTYKYPGLPPGPICNPSLGSIVAALNPAQSDYLYFFHQQPGGQAVFSKTFDEHKRQMAQ